MAQLDFYVGYMAHQQETLRTPGVDELFLTTQNRFYGLKVIVQLFLPHIALAFSSEESEAKTVWLKTVLLKTTQMTKKFLMLFKSVLKLCGLLPKIFSQITLQNSSDNNPRHKYVNLFSHTQKRTNGKLNRKATTKHYVP